MSHVIPDFVYKAIIKQSPFEILGDGKQIRTFTHVKDIADAISIMIKNSSKNTDFNICGGEINTISIEDLAISIWEKVNSGIRMPKFKHLLAPSDDVRFRVGVSKKAENLLGWKPTYNLDYITNDVIKFINNNLDKIKK